MKSPQLSRRSFAGALGVATGLAAAFGGLRRAAAAGPEPPPALPIRIGSNESPYGPSEKALAAMRQAGQRPLREPPDDGGDPHPRAHGVRPRRVVVELRSGEVFRGRPAAHLRLRERGRRPEHPRSGGLDSGGAPSTRRSKALTEVGRGSDLDRRDTKATSLLLEQPQKLCLARLLPLKPDVILMDEPARRSTSRATRGIEELMFALLGRYTIVIVTHNMAKARQASDESRACMLLRGGRGSTSGHAGSCLREPAATRARRST